MTDGKWLGQIPGHGRTASSCKGYAGRSPKTGEAIQVAPKRLPFFRVGKNLAASIDAGWEKKQEK